MFLQQLLRREIHHLREPILLLQLVLRVHQEEVEVVVHLEVDVRLVAEDDNFFFTNTAYVSFFVKEKKESASTLLLRHNL